MQKGEAGLNTSSSSKQETGGEESNPRRSTAAGAEEETAACQVQEDQQLHLAGPVALTDFGESARTVAIVGMGGGLVCSRTHDWRAALPRYLGHLMAADVIVYYRKGLCRYCWLSTGGSQGQGPSRCQQQLLEGVDLMVVVGSGKIKESTPARCGTDPL